MAKNYPRKDYSMKFAQPPRPRKETISIGLDRYDALLKAELFLESMQRRLAAVEDDRPCIIVYREDLPL